MRLFSWPLMPTSPGALPGQRSTTGGSDANPVRARKTPMSREPAKAIRFMTEVLFGGCQNQRLLGRYMMPQQYRPTRELLIFGVWTFSIRCNSRHFLISWDLFWSRTRNRYFVWDARDLSTKRLFPRRGLIIEPRGLRP